MSSTEKYDWYGLSGVRQYSGSIIEAARLIGLPPEAIAGAVAEEYEWHEPLENASTVFALEWHRTLLFAAWEVEVRNGLNVPWEDYWEIKIQLKFEDALNDETSKDNRLTNSSLGPSSIRMNTAIPLLMRYIRGLPTDDVGRPVENTGYDLLKYHGDYEQLALDLMNDMKLHFLFTGLILKEAELFFSDKAERDKILDAYLDPIAAAEAKGDLPDIDLAWRLMDLDTRIGLTRIFHEYPEIKVTVYVFANFRECCRADVQNQPDSGPQYAQIRRKEVI